MSVPFRDLEVWQAAMRLASTVQALTAGAAGGEHEELADTLQRAAALIPDAIAQGHSSDCLQTFTRKLADGQGACTTVTAQLLRLRDGAVGHAEMIDESLSLADRVGRMLLRLHQALSRKLAADAAVSASQSR